MRTIVSLIPAFLLVASIPSQTVCDLCAVSGPFEFKGAATTWQWSMGVPTWGECHDAWPLCIPGTPCTFSWTLTVSSTWSVVQVCRSEDATNCIGGIGTFPHPTLPGEHWFSWNATGSPLACGESFAAYLMGDSNGALTLLGKVWGSCGLCPNSPGD